MFMQRKWWERLVSLGCLLGLMGFTGCVGCPTQGPIQYVSDSKITQQVEHALQKKNPHIQHGVTVKTFDGVVSLHGTVNSPDDRAKLVSTAEKVPGVRTVLDYMVVKTPGSQKT